MARQITLTRLAPTNVDFSIVSAFRLRLDATSTGDVPVDPKLFLWLQGEADPVSGVIINTFATVCSPIDLSEYPADAPTLTPTSPEFKYFRRSWVDIYLPSANLLDIALVAITNQVNVLIDTLNQWDVLNVSTPIVCNG